MNYHLFDLGNFEFFRNNKYIYLRGLGERFLLLIWAKIPQENERKD